MCARRMPLGRTYKYNSRNRLEKDCRYTQETIPPGRTYKYNSRNLLSMPLGRTYKYDSRNRF